MKNKALISMLLLLALSALPSTALGIMNVMDDKLSVDSSASLGYEYKHVDGDRPSQFEAYRDVPKGFIFESLHLYTEWNDPKLPYYLKLDGVDLNQDDKNLCLEAGRYGMFRLKFNYKESPRLFSTHDRFLEHYVGNGRYVIDPSVQRDLTDVNGNGVIPPTDGADVPLPATFTDFTDLRSKLTDHINAAGEVDLKFKRETSMFDFLVNVAPGLNFTADYKHEHKEGTKVTSNSVYDRRNLFSTGDGLVNDFEQFRLVIFELPEQIDWDSDIVNAGFQFARDNFMVNLGYTFQSFKNNIDALRWDNPFRSAPDLDINTDAAIAAADRDRYRGIATSHGLQVLPPDSYSHTGTLSGSLDLPFMNARLAGTVSAGGTWQDDDFFPFSTNTAMVITGDGLANDPANLPKKSLDGFILNVVQNYTFTMRPIDPLTVTGKYRYYYYDNQTDKITSPGYAARADSQWVAEETANKVPSYLRQNGSLELDYDINRMLSARADYGWERWRRWGRNVRHIDEHKVGGGVTVKPIDWFKLLVDYHWSHRLGDDYTPLGTLAPTETETPTARMWDQSNRVRHEAKTSFVFNPLTNLDFCAHGSLIHDSYKTERLGLKRDYGWTAGGEFTFTPVGFLTVTANYCYDEFWRFVNDGSKTSVTGPTFIDQNLWYTKLRDRTHNFGVDVNARVVPDTLELETSYHYTRGDGRITTYNPNPPVPDVTINSAIAYPYPDNKVVDHEVRAELTYRFLKHFALSVRYIYENFRIRDFAWADLGNQIASVTQTLDGTTATINETSRVALLNNQFSDYEAHVGMVTLGYLF